MLRTIIFIVFIMLVLSFFGISIREVATSPAGQENFGFLWELIKSGWQAIVDLWHTVTEALAGFFQPIRFPR